MEGNGKKGPGWVWEIFKNEQCNFWTIRKRNFYRFYKVSNIQSWLEVMYYWPIELNKSECRRMLNEVSRFIDDHLYAVRVNWYLWLLFVSCTRYLLLLSLWSSYLYNSIDTWWLKSYQKWKHMWGIISHLVNNEWL